MKAIIFLLIVVLVLGINFVYSQTRYEKFLLKNHQTDASDSDVFEPIFLKCGYIVKFSQNDSMNFVNLVSKQKTTSLFGNLKSDGTKSLGGLCADYNSCFFWGHVFEENIIGKLYYKNTPLTPSESLVYIDKKRDYLLVASLESLHRNKIVIYLMNIVKKSKIKYFLPEQVSYYDIKYLKLKRANNSTIQLFNNNTTKVFELYP